MKILYAKTFEKDLNAIKHHQEIRKHLLEKIETLKKIKSPAGLKGARKIAGFPSYYRSKPAYKAP